MHCAHAVDKSVCSACAARLHEPLRDVPIWLPAGDPRKAFRHLESALRNARSATGASVGLSVEKLFAFPLKNAFGGRGKALDGAAGFLPIGERARETLWNAPRRCIAKLWTADHPWRRRACFRRSPRTFLESRKTQYSWASWRLKRKSWRHFHGHSRSAGFLWKSCWQTVPEAGRRGWGFGRAMAWPGEAFCRVPPNGCRYLVDKAVGKVLEKMPCQVVLMTCRVGCFLSSADVAKLPGRSEREASQGPGWAPDTLWITL